MLTELDKTILLSLLVMGKNERKYIPDDRIIFKFPPRQRKMVKKYMGKLEKDGLIECHPTKTAHRLTENGFKEAKKLLIKGAMLWTYR